MTPSTGDDRSLVSRRPPTEDLRSRSCELESASVRTVLDEIDGPVFHWISRDGFEIVGCGVTAHLRGSGPTRFEELKEAADRTFSSLTHTGPAHARPRAVGGLSFHDGETIDGIWRDFQSATFILPRIQITRSDEGTWLTVTDEDDPSDCLERWRDRILSWTEANSTTDEESNQNAPLRSDGEPATADGDVRGDRPGIARITPITTRGRYVDAVETVTSRIDDGQLHKAVIALSTTAELETSLEPTAVFERLANTYPECYRLLVDLGGDRTLFGAPPERLVAQSGRVAQTEALAGSISRGETPAEDRANAQQLLEQPKFGREHEFVVEVIESDLESISSSIDIGDRGVRRLETIQHLHTPITANLDADYHVLDVVEALHPTPAVGGVPPERACETIREIEDFDRGWYAAPVGWFDGDGDGEFAVCIRSALATDRHVTLFAGNGIVADSDPAEEFNEGQLKFRSILDTLR